MKEGPCKRAETLYVRVAWGRAGNHVRLRCGKLTLRFLLDFVPTNASMLLLAIGYGRNRQDLAQTLPRPPSLKVRGEDMLHDTQSELVQAVCMVPWAGTFRVLVMSS